MRASDDRLDRRRTWLLVGVSAGLLVALAAWLVPWDWTPTGWVPGSRGRGGTGLRVAPAARFFSPSQLARAEEYARGARLLFLAAQAASLGVVAALGLTPLGSRLSGPVARGVRWWLAVPLVVLAVLAAERVVTLPFALLQRQRDLLAGLTNQGASGWWRDRAVSLLVSWVLVSVIVLLIVGTARRFPRHWPGWAGLGAVALTFAGSLLYPLLVEPAFNRFSPVPDGPLKQSVLRLARREGVRLDGILVADASRRTTTLNAYVSGLAGSRRVVVYDNLLRNAPRRQVLAVVAHELGHAREHDVLVGTALGALGGVVGVGLLALVLDGERLRRRAGAGGPQDVRTVPLVLVLLASASLLSLPAQNVVSRSVEARADRAALTATGDPVAFRAVQRTLALRSLADPTPPPWYQAWFGTHPTVLQRLGLADAYAEARRR